MPSKLNTSFKWDHCKIFKAGVEHYSASRKMGWCRCGSWRLYRDSSTLRTHWKPTFHLTECLPWIYLHYEDPKVAAKEEEGKNSWRFRSELGRETEEKEKSIKRTRILSFLWNGRCATSSAHPWVPGGNQHGAKSQCRQMCSCFPKFLGKNLLDKRMGVSRVVYWRLSYGRAAQNCPFTLLYLCLCRRKLEAWLSWWAWIVNTA